MPLPLPTHFVIDAAFRAAIDIVEAVRAGRQMRLTAFPSLEDEPAPPASPGGVPGRNHRFDRALVGPGR
jgi:hypothetical protein